MCEFVYSSSPVKVSPWHGIEARVDSLMASVSTDTSKSFSVHLKTKRRSPLAETHADRNVLAWHAVCHIRTFDRYALCVLVNLSLASGDEELGIIYFQR